jgi:hypothetical protein
MPLRHLRGLLLVLPFHGLIGLMIVHGLRSEASVLLLLLARERLALLLLSRLHFALLSGVRLLGR